MRDRNKTSRTLAILLAWCAVLPACAQTGVQPKIQTGVQASVQTPLPVQPQSQTLPSSLPPASYVVNPGDVLDIAFRWTPEFNQTVTVQPDGRASLTSAGDIKVAGETLLEVRDEIIRHSSDKVVNPEVAVTLRDFERPRIAVAGEVVSPGKYDLRQPTTALQAILLAGGPKETAQMSDVVLFRPMANGFSEVHRLSFKHLGDPNHPVEDIALRPGDMLLVPRDKLTKIGRFVRTFNLGVYFNPATGAVF